MPAIPASHRDLLDGQFATLATVGPDGRPQLSEVWFLADGDAVAVSLNTSRQKTTTRSPIKSARSTTPISASTTSRASHASR